MNYFEVADITDEERNGIRELRKCVENEMNSTLLKDNTIFIRFLRARECNVQKASEMLRNHIEWRRMNNIDNIKNYKFPEVIQFTPTSLIGYDKSGTVFRYNDVGNADARGILRSTKKDDLQKYLVQEMESDVMKMRQQSEKLGKTIYQWLYIADFENFSFASATNKATLQFYLHFIRAYEANFPERLKAMIIINASIYFQIFFNVIKPLLSPSTLKKVLIFGKDGWKEKLQSNVDADVLPVFLGGKRTDENGDPRCSAFVKTGSPVPHSYYFRSSESRLSHLPNINKLVVTRMSKMSIELDVKRAGNFIEWEFETESGDIAYGLFSEATDQSEVTALKEIIPVQRVDANIARETGIYKCEEPGKYILQFCNSHSWIRSKQVFYRIEVVESTE